MADKRVTTLLVTLAVTVEADDAGLNDALDTLAKQTEEQFPSVNTGRYGAAMWKTRCIGVHSVEEASAPARR